MYGMAEKYIFIQCVAQKAVKINGNLIATLHRRPVYNDEGTWGIGGRG